MALDGLVVRAAVHELQMLCGGRIHKIYQPSEDTVLMQIRLEKRNVRLLFSAHPVYPRVHLTTQTFVNPLEAPMFCMLLRKHLEGAVIEQIEQSGMERILCMTVRHRDELGDITAKKWIAEIMGRHSNLILCDAHGKILDGIHHVTPAISSYRIVLPGQDYTPPPEQDKRDPLEVDRSGFAALYAGSRAQSAEDDGQDWNPSRFLLKTFSGLSPLAADEIVFRTGSGPAHQFRDMDEREGRMLWDAFDSVMADIRRNRFHPQIKHRSGGKEQFSVIDLTHIAGEAKAFASISECLEAFYGEKAERDAIKTKAANLIRLLQNEKNKNEKKIQKFKQTLEAAQEADRFRKMGELLTASLHLVKRGDSAVEAVDYYDERQPTVTISLDPQLNPSENAQRYFKKYTKLKNSMEYVKEQLETARREIEYLDGILTQFSTVTLADLDEIREELIEQGYVRRRGKSAKKKKDDKPRLYKYTSSEGIAVYVGKNNLQNEYLTNRLADSSDTWLHTKDIPGSHVVIRSRDYGEATLHEAASLAAYFSKAKDSSQVPVDYTLIKHVRKPSGAKPGYVIYDHQKTLFVTPDPGLPEKLESGTV